MAFRKVVTGQFAAHQQFRIRLELPTMIPTMRPLYVIKTYYAEPLLISSFQLTSVAAVMDYHADAFSLGATREGASYEQTDATWGGAGAGLAGLGVGSKVERGDFQAVLEGRIADKSLPGGYSAEQGGRYHKPGMDFTFSPGKSVSLVALVGSDERLIGAHGAAVESAMRFLEERGARARIGGRPVETGNLLYSKFEHITSRQQDPQVHTHVVIANATQDEHGSWRALDNSELLKLRKQADRVYGQALDGHLRNLGYHTTPGKSGPEISGFDRDQLQAFSVRTRDIEGFLAAKGLTLESATAPQKQLANLATRPDKEALPREQLVEMWRETAAAVGLNVSRMSAQRLEPAKVQVKEPRIDNLGQALAHLASRAGEHVHTFESARTNALKSPNDQERHAAVGVMGKELSHLQPMTAGQIRGLVAKDPALKYVSTDQVRAALSTAVSQGTFQTVGDRFSPSNADHSACKSTLMDTAIAVLRADMVDAGKRFDDKLAAFNAPGGGTSAGMQELMTSYMPTKSITHAQAGTLVRAMGADLKNAEVKDAVGRATNAGAFTEKDGKVSVNPTEDQRRASAVNEARSRFTQPEPHSVDQALGRVLTRMDAAKQDFPGLMQEVKLARRAGNRARLKAAEQHVRKAEQLVSMSPAQLRTALREELGEPKRVGVAPLISNAVLDAGIKRAMAAGFLQRNVDKLSVESESQTDARLHGDKTDRTAHVKERRTQELAVRKVAKAKELKTRQAERKEISAARVKALTPAQRKNLGNKSATVRGLKTAAYVLANPVRGSGNILSRAVKSYAKNATLRALEVSGQAPKGVVTAVATQAVASFGGAQRRAQAWEGIRERQVTLQGRGIVRGDSSVKLYNIRPENVTRVKLSVSNAALLIVSGALSASKLDRTAGGAVLRNAMLGAVKMKKVSAEEALAVRAVAAAVRGLGKVVQYGHHKLQDHRFQRELGAFERNTEARRAAYLEHVKSAVAFEKGSLDAQGLQASKTRLGHALAEGEKSFNKLLGVALERYSAGRMTEASVERITVRKNELTAAVKQFKEGADMQVTGMARMLQVSPRELKQIEQRGGKDVLELSAMTTEAKARMNRGGQRATNSLYDGQTRGKYSAAGQREAERAR